MGRYTTSIRPKITSMFNAMGRQPAVMEKPDSCWNFISSSFMRSLSSLYFSWISCIIGWKADMRTVLFCCLSCSGNMITLVTSVKMMMVQP